MTSQGHPRTQFRRALERGNLVMAELTARECGRLDQSESIALTALVAEKDRPRSRRMCALAVDDRTYRQPVSAIEMEVRRYGRASRRPSAMRM